MGRIDKTFKKQSGNVWVDHNGREVDAKRITRREKFEEGAVTKLINMAVKIHDGGYELKKLVFEYAEKAYRLFLAENGEVFEGMKTYTFYNFDKTLKVVFDIESQIEYDENKMLMAYETFKQFIGDKMPPELGFMETIISDAFKNRNGRFDNKKVNLVLSHRDDEYVKDNEVFQKAIEYIVSAKRVSGVKEYPKFYFIDGGQIHQVNLQFSAISISDDEDVPVPDRVVELNAQPADHVWVNPTSQEE